MPTPLEAMPVASASTVTCRVVPVEADLHEHVSRRYWDWRALYARAAQAVPMQHPDYVLGEARHAPTRRLQPILIVAERHGECVGVAPLIPKVCATNRIGGMGLNRRVTGLRLAGNGFLTIDDDAAIITALTRAALEQVTTSRAAFLLIEDLDEQTPLARAVTAETPTNWMPFRHAGIQPRRRIQFPETATEYWKHFSKKHSAHSVAS
jgi:hypothetical protein